MPKKKNTKNTSRKVSSSSGVRQNDDHSFLIILGGGFIIITLAIFFLTRQSSMTSQLMTKMTTEVLSEKEQVITINNFKFSPESITVKAGTTVTWLNSDTVDHAIAADDMSFDIGVVAPGEKGSYAFTKAGTYTYHCAAHPSMTATVVVE